MQLSKSKEIYLITLLANLVIRVFKKLSINLQNLDQCYFTALVEMSRFELPTSALQKRRSPT